MPASNHTILGTVQALQYTGTNAAEIQSVLGNGWSVYTNPTTSILAVCQVGAEMFLNGNLIHATDWIVTQPAYANETPALSAGFAIVPNSIFTKAYSA